MQHTHDLGDDVKTLLGDIEPGIEGTDQLGAEVLAGMANDIIIRSSNYALLLIGPGLLLGEVEVLAGISFGVWVLAGLLHIAVAWVCDGSWFRGRALLLAEPIGLDEHGLEDGFGRLCGEVGDAGEAAARGPGRDGVGG